MPTDPPRRRDLSESPPHVRWFARSFGRPVFPALSPEDLGEVAATFAPVTFEPAAVLFRAGDPAAGVYVIMEGTVYVRSGSSGRLLARFGAGSALGDAEAIAAGPYRVTAQAYSRVAALRAAHDRFVALLAGRPRITLRWLDVTLRTREAALERIEQLLGGSVEARLCAALLELADERGYVYQTHEGLAELIGARRETVSRGMARLRAGGVIETLSAGVVVLDRERALALVPVVRA